MEHFQQRLELNTLLLEMLESVLSESLGKSVAVVSVDALLKILDFGAKSALHQFEFGESHFLFGARYSTSQSAHFQTFALTAM